MFATLLFPSHEKTKGYRAMRKYRIIQKCIQQVLLLLCTGFYLGHTWADANIITFYVTNEGIIATIGLESKDRAEQIFSVGVDAQGHELLLDPPNLTNDDSPLKALSLLMQRHGYLFTQILTSEQRKKLPTKIYIAGAGADRAGEQSKPEDHKIDEYLTDNNWQCRNAVNKKHFHACMFSKKVEETVPGLKTTYAIENDTYLMATMATIHDQNSQSGKSDDNNHPILALHTTTYAVAALVKTDGKIEINSKSVNPDAGGIYNLGQCFSDSLDDHKQNIINSEDNQPAFEKHLESMPAVASAIYQSWALHQIYYQSTARTLRGAPAMYCRLVQRKKGYSIFGNLCLQVASNGGCPLQPESFSTVPYDHQQAKKEAALKVEEVFDNLLTEIISSYIHMIFEERIKAMKVMSRENSTDSISKLIDAMPVPQLVLVGEYINLLEGLDGSGNEETFRTFGLNRLSQREYTDSLYKKFSLGYLAENVDTFYSLLSMDIVPLIGAAKVVPREKFSHYLHQGAVKRLAVLSGNA